MVLESLTTLILVLSTAAIVGFTAFSAWRIFVTPSVPFHGSQEVVPRPCPKLGREVGALVSALGSTRFS